MRLTISRRLIALATLLGLLLGLLALQSPARAIEKTVLQNNLRASVKLGILDANDETMGTCSGTFVDARGYILTNFHCVGQTDIYGPDEETGLAHGDYYNPKGLLVVAINDNPRQMPTPTYIAQVVAGNPDQDIAVLKIISFLDSKQKLPERLPITIDKLVDSDKVDIGDKVTVIGYPGVGGETVTLTNGAISGFQDDDEDNVTDWFKTDVLINGGNSGGTAVNENGEMVGIPSAKLVEDIDTIYFIKPVNQAIPVIERALSIGNSDTKVQGGGSTTGGATIPAGQNIGTITFGTDFKKDKIVGTATTFASGLKTVHAAVPYQKMRDGTAWGYAWNYEGSEAVSDTSLKWDLGEAGVVDVYLNGPDKGALPDGNYALQIFIGKKVVQEASFTVGTGDVNKEAPAKPSEIQSDGVLLTGTIIDQDTEDPIEGAVIIFLKPGVPTAKFDGSKKSEQLVQAYGVTDTDGTYTLDQPLPYGKTFSVIVGADGYTPQAIDDAFETTKDLADYVELDPITLQKE